MNVIVGQFCPKRETSIGSSHGRSAAAPYESHIWTAALRRATSGSVNSNSLAGMESAGFHSALLASHHLALQLDYFLLVGVERDAILDCPDRANRTNVCPLRAQERVQVQTLWGDDLAPVCTGSIVLRRLPESINTGKAGRQTRCESAPKPHVACAG